MIVQLTVFFQEKLILKKAFYEMPTNKLMIFENIYF